MAKSQKPLFASRDKKPLAQLSNSTLRGYNLIRSSFSIRTWLLVGGALQAMLIALPVRRIYAVAPVSVLLTWQIVDSMLMAFELKKNVYMNGVIAGKYSAVYPGEDGSFERSVKGGPGGDEITVVLLGVRANHPMGGFNSAFMKAGAYLESMIKDLEEHAEEYGWLGATSWLNAGDRETTNEYMLVHYFRSIDGLHKFAHAKAHRDGWDWYNEFVKQGKGKTGTAANTHLAFYHEVYSAPAGRWENIYLNCQPAGFGTTSHPVSDKETDTTRWMSGIIDASRSKMRSSAGRIGLDNGDGNQKYGDEPYQEIEA